ncbi:MAG TPA: phosphoribosyl-AMP cyclohydrolase [Nocardioidaceae bacterium]|nr:phosphoribosyl-AMP cyclohydrolase [Nocardioidaceae bacterium]
MTQSSATGAAALADPWEDSLQLDANGLLPVVVQEASSGEVLMLAWMNREALRRTLRTRRATYWSRSRRTYWVKGETSGHVQRVVDARLDCDGDTILLVVDQTGPACHTGSGTCFEGRSLLSPEAGAGDGRNG